VYKIKRVPFFARTRGREEGRRLERLLLRSRHGSSNDACSNKRIHSLIFYIYLTYMKSKSLSRKVTVPLNKTQFYVRRQIVVSWRVRIELNQVWSTIILHKTESSCDHLKISSYFNSGIRKGKASSLRQNIELSIKPDEKGP